MNLTEMEAKVREATNNEPWGASSTLMQQIAGGTYNYREREEIVSFIFRRFTEKAANEWRQIYKSLQLLEYLIKNGSERIIDDVRANLSLIQMLKSFHYIDSKGRDQGLNVRNRTKTLVALLNDDALIRSERKKARNNAKKFGGVSSGAFGGASSITPGSNMGYDDDYSNRVYGDGGVYGERYDDPASAYNSNSNENFEEYNVETPSSSSKPTTGSSRVHATGSSSASKSKPQPQEPQQDLLQDLVTFDENKSSNQAPAPVEDEDNDDDFDDFQAAPSQPQKPNLSNNLSNLYHQQTTQPTFFQNQHQQSNIQQQPQQQFNNGVSNYDNITSSSSAVTSSGPAKPSNNDAFSSLFSSAKTKSKTSTPSVSTTKKEQETPASSNNNDDFFGDFSSNTTSNANGNSASANSNNANNNNSNNNGEIDLLSF